MKFLAVIDTNVLVSAMLNYDSIPGGIIELIIQGCVVPLINTDIISEYKEVLSRSKFRFAKEIVDEIINEFIMKGIYIDEEDVDVELPDLDDKVFYNVVMKGRKENDAYLVTGNIKHFPKELFIVTPREFYDIINSSIDSKMKRIFLIIKKISIKIGRNLFLYVSSDVDDYYIINFL